VNRNCGNPGVQVEKLREHHLRTFPSGRITEESNNGELALFDREALAWLTSRTDRNQNEPKEELVRCFWNGHCQDLERTKTKKVHTEEVERVRELIYVQAVEVNERKNIADSGVSYLIPGQA
jgi:hypothetical protein